MQSWGKKWSLNFEAKSGLWCLKIGEKTDVHILVWRAHNKPIHVYAVMIDMVSQV